MFVRHRHIHTHATRAHPAPRTHSTCNSRDRLAHGDGRILDVVHSQCCFFRLRIQTAFGQDTNGQVANSLCYSYHESEKVDRVAVRLMPNV
jgi:hypothetical protein